MNSEGIITVSGHAQLTKMPDLARFVITVNSNARTGPHATGDTTLTAARLIDMIKNHPINSIERDSRSLRPVHSWENEKKVAQVVGYESIVRLHIKTTPENVGPLMDKVNEYSDHVYHSNGSVSISMDGLSFDLSSKQETELTLLGLAAKDANKKAIAIAEALNLELSKMVEIVENGNSYNGYPRMAAMSMASLEGMPRREKTMIEPGLMTFEASVMMKASMK